jgi:DNA-binding NtrC family response regulator
VAQRVAMLCDAPEVGAGELGLPGVAPRKALPLAPAAQQANGARSLSFDFESGAHTAEQVERELILQALQRTRGNVSRAAKLIGMQRSSFRYRIDRFGLQDMVQEIANR